MWRKYYNIVKTSPVFSKKEAFEIKNDNELINKNKINYLQQIQSNIYTSFIQYNYIIIMITNITANYMLTTVKLEHTNT